MNNKQDKYSRHQFFSICGMIAPVFFTFMVIIESLLRPGYSQILNNISDLGVGHYAILQNINFIVFGLLSIGFALGLRRRLPSTREKVVKSCERLVIIFGLGIMLAGISLLFIGIYSKNLIVLIHGLVSIIAFITIVAAQIWVWRALKNNNDKQWKYFKIYSFISGLISLLLLIAFIYTSNNVYHGLTERAFIAVPWVWIGITGLKLYSTKN